MYVETSTEPATLGLSDFVSGFVKGDDDDELMLNVLRCHLTY